MAIERDRFGLVPTDITIVVLHHGGANATDDQRVGAMAVALQAGVIEAVRPLRPDWSRRQILDNVQGFLSAENIFGGAQSINNGEDHRVVFAHELESGIFLGNSLKLIIGLLLIVQESNADIALQDLRWTFHLDAFSFMGGRGKPKKPQWVKNYHYPFTWEEHLWQGVPLSCAAFALVYAMNPPTRAGKRALLSLKAKAQDLLLLLNWLPTVVDGQTLARVVTPNDLQAFVLLPQYAHYRVTLLTPNFDRASISFAGSDFIYDPDDTSNLIYLYWDLQPASWHYAAVPPSRVQSLYRLQDANVKFCHKCAVAYRAYTDQNCDCHEPVERQPRQKKARRIDFDAPCRTCGKVVCGSECARTCSLCLSIRGKDHRCVVWSDPEVEEKTFWTLEEVEAGSYVDGDKPRLWVYDLEASIDSTEIGCRDFVRTDDGASFVLNNDGTPQVFVSTFQQHKVNLVVARCVFSGQEFIGTSVVEFLLFLQAQNAGNHVCIAHNGSGYDTRHIMDAALRCNPTKGAEIIPLNRGCKFLQMKIGNFIN